MPKFKVFLLPIAILIVLALSFWYSTGWLQLCAGLALFLFGMQCLEEGLKQLAGGKLEQVLARSTSTRFKSFLVGMGGTMLLQSTTLMSLLTIAFISTGLIQFASGIAILLGVNLGTSAGIWLLAAAGQNFSLSPLALPLLVFGVLAGFNGPKSKAAGRIVLGIAFIFLGIDQIKGGFSEFGSSLDLTEQFDATLLGQLAFVIVGIALTAVLQSSHATLMLVLAALAGGQIELWQAMTITIGGNIGSSVTTALVGWLSGNRSGQRLVLVHALFNIVTGIITFIFLMPLMWLAQSSMALFGAADNTLLQLAMFQTLFNVIGVIIFWPLQSKIGQWLCYLFPDPVEPEVLITAADIQPDLAIKPQLIAPNQARYLNEAALASADTAASAVVQELQHLGRLSLEVICHALYQPIEQLNSPTIDERLLNTLPDDSNSLDAKELYQLHIKGVYSDLLSFMSRLNIELDEEQQKFWMTCHMLALQLVDAVKNAKHLQKNVYRYLRDDSIFTRNLYLDLRRHVIWVLREAYALSRMELTEEQSLLALSELNTETERFVKEFRHRIFSAIRMQSLNNLQASSLMNDLNYSHRIAQSFSHVLQVSLTDDNKLLRDIRHLGAERTPLVSLI
ncbi:Na/Pi cotransporter family protein [Rheinheimera salexigens]|uniref:Sodium:phosphate symporter n=1 Tax=Rheinheimera salexigens TaxID=1628148 RepID=A0A1E7Q3D2_9GAMM|nr:Na/Pi symporter [Rheinheimera salexigens]OEY68702.1 sodium:phosphate symporter [Rheinheimera salexigens]